MVTTLRRFDYHFVWANRSANEIYHGYNITRYSVKKKKKLLCEVRKSKFVFRIALVCLPSTVASGKSNIPCFFSFQFLIICENLQGLRFSLMM